MSPAAAPSARPQLEVEYKFAVPAATRARLLAAAEAAGAEVCERTFRDEYYDDGASGMTLSDRWLRRRDGRWQLKVPVGMRGGGRGGMFVYREVEEEEMVWEELGRRERRAAGLECFARLETRRTEFAVPGLGVGGVEPIVVVMDCCRGFGGGGDEAFVHGVGEVEIVVRDERRVEEARRKVLRFCEENGIGGGEGARGEGEGAGKVETFLRERRPVMHARLVKAGVM